VAAHIAVRAEPKRSILAEKQQPKRTIFGVGCIRHNVANKETAQRFMDEAIAAGRVDPLPNRHMMEWHENPTVQRYDKHVSPKIGSIHQNVDINY